MSLGIPHSSASRVSKKALKGLFINGWVKKSSHIDKNTAYSIVSFSYHMHRFVMIVCFMPLGAGVLVICIKLIPYKQDLPIH